MSAALRRAVAAHLPVWVLATSTARRAATTRSRPPRIRIARNGATVMNDDDTIDVAALAAEEAHLAEQAEKIAHRREEIKNTLREHLPVGSTPAGAYTVQVRAGARRIDTRKVADKYPFDAYPELWSAAIDLDRVKRHLSPVDLEPFTTQGAAVVVVR